MMNYYVRIIFTFFSIGILFSKNPQFPNIESFKLDNGINVLVLPDYRKPIITPFINTGRYYKDIEDINFESYTYRMFLTPAGKKINPIMISMGIYDFFGDKYIYYNDPYMEEMGYKNYDFSLTFTVLKEDTKNILELSFDQISETEFYFIKSRLLGTLTSVTVPFLKFTGFLMGTILDPFFPDKQDRNGLYIRHSEYIFSDMKSIRDPLFFPNSRKALSRAYEKIIHPENMTLFITGDVNVLNIRKILNETFNKWENNSIPYTRKTFKKIITDSSGVTLRFIHSKKSTDKKNSNILSLILRNPDAHSPKLNKYASQIAANIILNKSENFKLYDNYEGHSNFFADRWNTLRLKFSISNSDTLLVEYDNICDEIKNMTTIGITQQELDSQKKKIEKNLKSIYSDANQFSFFVTSHLNAGFTLEELKDYWNNYNNVTLDQVNRSLLKLFDLDNIYIVAVGDKKQSESFINNFDNVELYNYKDKLK